MSLSGCQDGTAIITVVGWHSCHIAVDPLGGGGDTLCFPCTDLIIMPFFLERGAWFVWLVWCHSAMCGKTVITVGVIQRSTCTNRSQLPLRCKAQLKPHYERRGEMWWTTYSSPFLSSSCYLRQLWVNVGLFVHQSCTPWEWWLLSWLKSACYHWWWKSFGLLSQSITGQRRLYWFITPRHGMECYKSI